MATAATDVNPRKTLEEYAKDNADVNDGAQEPVCYTSTCYCIQKINHQISFQSILYHHVSVSYTEKTKNNGRKTCRKGMLTNKHFVRYCMR